MSPAAYPHPVERVRLIETHVSWILLTGSYAYKLKRPVHYPFVDMRLPEQRHFLCREELRLNRRLAPELYLDVVPVTSEAGAARIGGTANVIEHAVRMRQFDTREELDRLLAEGHVEPSELGTFGERLAEAHRRFPSVGAGQSYGRATAIARSLLENVVQWQALSARAGLADDVADIEPALRQRIETGLQVMDARRARGRVKECHGDLHCRNVVRSAGHLVAFDALEFEAAFRWIDVAEEVAFLFMDLRRRGGHAHASAFLNRYLAQSGDFGIMQLLRLYGAHRALVRAKVAALEYTAATRSPERQRLRSDYAAYVTVARDLLKPGKPRLVLMSGMSGSGKTWLAQRLAPRLSAVHVRSDVERKRLASLPEHESSRSGIDQGLYAPEANVDTYRRLAACASHIVAGGFSAIVDATFQRRADRALFSRLAREAGVPLVLVRCRAPVDVLRTRILERGGEGHDASEANLAVLDRQRATFEVIDPGESLEVIDADTTHDMIVEEVEAALHDQP
jgi:aminoglycoside phosphotransferase family enzyme/predicted kinase